MATLATLRTKVRRKLDETSADFWSDNDIDDYLNQAYYYYWNWAIQAQYRQCLQSTTLNITAGTAEVALPSDFIKIRLLEKVASDRTIPLRFNERYEEQNATSGVGTSTETVFSYSFVGSNIVLQPTPQVTETGGLKITYFYQPTELSDDADTPDLDDFHDNLLIQYAVVQAKEKEEAIGNGGTDLAPFVMTLTKLEQSFKEIIETDSIQRFYAKPFYTYS